MLECISCGLSRKVLVISLVTFLTVKLDSEKVGDSREVKQKRFCFMKCSTMTIGETLQVNKNCVPVLDCKSLDSSSE